MDGAWRRPALARRQIKGQVMTGWEFWIVAVVAAILTGIGKGGVPIVGSLVVPVLSLVISPVTAAGLMLPV